MNTATCRGFRNHAAETLTAKVMHSLPLPGLTANAWTAHFPPTLPPFLTLVLRQLAGGSQVAFFLLAIPTSPSRPEQNSQAAAGTGTDDTDRTCMLFPLPILK